MRQPLNALGKRRGEFQSRADRSQPTRNASVMRRICRGVCGALTRGDHRNAPNCCGQGAGGNNPARTAGQQRMAERAAGFAASNGIGSPQRTPHTARRRAPFQSRDQLRDSTVSRLPRSSASFFAYDQHLSWAARRRASVNEANDSARSMAGGGSDAVVR